MLNYRGLKSIAEFENWNILKTEQRWGWINGQEVRYPGTLRILNLLGLDPEGTGAIKGLKEVSDPRGVHFKRFPWRQCGPEHRGDHGRNTDGGFG